MKLLIFFALSFPVILTAQIGGNFGGDFEKPEGGGPPGKPPAGKPPMDGGNMHPLYAPDSLEIHEQKAFENAFASADIMNRNSEAFISVLAPLTALPNLPVKWEEMKEELKKRETQAEKNQALKIHKEYLSRWDTLIFILDTVWAKDDVRKSIGLHLDSLKDTLILMRDSITLAIEMNKNSSTVIETRLKETREMLAKLNSNSEQPEQTSQAKTMLFMLKVDIINMENDIEILNRERRLGEEILVKLNEFE